MAPAAAISKQAPVIVEPKPHLCPAPSATHPRDRWETMFVYSFVCKFTNLRAKVEGFENVTDLETALLQREPSTILQQVLTRFVLNLRPNTRNLSPDQISNTVAAVTGDFFKTNERTCFWDDELMRNVDPFEGRDDGLFASEWDFKLKMLRLLVDLQLTHSVEVKGKIDRAWGVLHQTKSKKKETLPPMPDPSDPDSRENLKLDPIGQDNSRNRYWVVDDSPRMYTSNNPWRLTCVHKTKCTSREEYLASIEELKASAPQKASKKPTKQESNHLTLIAALETRVETIDRELRRVQRVRKKMEQKQILMAQAELRSTRTRRQTKKPEYVYNDDDEEDDGADDYQFQDEEDDDFAEAEGSEAGSSRGRLRRGTAPAPQRRSARTANKPAAASDRVEWKGERRSTRLGRGRSESSGPDEDSERPFKRARTDESASVRSVEAESVTSAEDAASRRKQAELEAQPAGKKKSKFYYYVVEPVPGAPDHSDAGATNGDAGAEPHVPHQAVESLELNGDVDSKDSDVPMQSAGQEDGVLESNETDVPMQSIPRENGEAESKDVNGDSSNGIVCEPMDLDVTNVENT